MELTNREAARRASVSERTLRRWRAGGMPFRVDEVGEVRMLLEDVMRWKRRQAFMNPLRRRRSGS